MDFYKNAYQSTHYLIPLALELGTSAETEGTIAALAQGARVMLTKAKGKYPVASELTQKFYKDFAPESVESNLLKIQKAGEYGKLMASKIKKPSLKALIYGGVSLGALGALGYPIYKSHQACRVELNKTIQKMNVEIKEWERKYNEELEKNKVIEDLKVKDAEKEKTIEDQGKTIQEIEKILKKNGLTLNQSLERHYSELTYIRDTMMRKIYSS